MASCAAPLVRQPPRGLRPTFATLLDNLLGRAAESPYLRYPVGGPPREAVEAVKADLKGAELDAAMVLAPETTRRRRLNAHQAPHPMDVLHEVSSSKHPPRSRTRVNNGLAVIRAVGCVAEHPWQARQLAKVPLLDDIDAAHPFLFYDQLGGYSLCIHVAVSRHLHVGALRLALVDLKMSTLPAALAQALAISVAAVILLTSYKNNLSLNSSTGSSVNDATSQARKVEGSATPRAMHDASPLSLRCICGCCDGRDQLKIVPLRAAVPVYLCERSLSCTPLTAHAPRAAAHSTLLLRGRYCQHHARALLRPSWQLRAP